jgi:hypothetical protein
MLKAALTLLAIAAGSAFAVTTGNTIYSAFQFQWPAGTALKVTPDPANAWSWHKDIPQQSQRFFETVLVDFDQNGRMDTEYENLRVLITDVQVTNGAGTIWLGDGSQRRWRIYPPQIPGGYGGVFGAESHFTTPLVLPAYSELKIEFEGGSGAGCHIDIIGRVVTL